MYHFDEKDIAEAIRLSLQSNVKQPTSEAEADGEQKEDDSQTASDSDDFDSYPKILSRLGDTDFIAGSARGDGYCSIWSVIIGRSLISEQLFNPVLLSQFGKTQPTTIQEVIEILLHVSNTILLLLDEQEVYIFNETMSILKIELKEFINQLEIPFQYLNTIIGVGQIKILAYLMNCNIIMKDTNNCLTYSINKSGSTIIRISTNMGHYYTHNNIINNEIFLVTTKWWDHMWTWFDYPPLIGKTDKMIPFIE